MRSLRQWVLLFLQQLQRRNLMESPTLFLLPRRCSGEDSMSLYSGVIDVGVRIELYKRLRNKEEEVHASMHKYHSSAWSCRPRARQQFSLGCYSHLFVGMLCYPLVYSFLASLLSPSAIRGDAGKERSFLSMFFKSFLPLCSCSCSSSPLYCCCWEVAWNRHRSSHYCHHQCRLTATTRASCRPHHLFFSWRGWSAWQCFFRRVNTYLMTILIVIRQYRKDYTI